MLVQPDFDDISIDTYKWVRVGRNSQHLVVSFQ